MPGGAGAPGAPNGSTRTSGRSTGFAGTGISRPSMKTRAAWYTTDSVYGVWWSIPHSFEVSSMSITVGVNRTRCAASARSLPAR